MTTNQKSVGLAAGMIIATLAVIGILTQANRPAGDHSDHQQTQSGQHRLRHEDHLRRGKLTAPKGDHVSPDAPQIDAVRGKMSAEEGRQRYASTLNQRMGRRQKIQVTTEGPAMTTLKMTWPSEGVGEGHIEKFKRAKPFFAELKGRGYSKLSCWIGNKEIWSKDL